MRHLAISWYRSLVFGFPVTTLILTVSVILGLGYYAKDFKLDASADSLVLEHDKDLLYYRGTRARYGSDDFLVVTYTPKGDLFGESARTAVKNMRDDLAALPRVSSVTSYLDVPLINSPKVSFTEIRRKTRTLESDDVNIEMAKREFQDSPLYRNLIVSPDSKTTALQVNIKRDDAYLKLLNRRNELRQIEIERKLTHEEQQELGAVSQEFRQLTERLSMQERNDIAAVRAILDKYRDGAEIHLGGVPMITADMIDYIKKDISVFGIGVVCFIILILAVSFHRPRWISIPIMICLLACIGMVGYLGFADWRVTVVSSNFISLLLIISLSLTVHLVVRYQELHHDNPEGNHFDMTWESIRSKFAPSFYTTLTTMVAFGSLIVSGIRPVIDFGWMMVCGVGLAFILTFILFPPALLLTKRGNPIKRKHDVTSRIMHTVAHIIENNSATTLIVFTIIAGISVLGLARLSVENRFIDYFKESTEIYQGMALIDKELGGTIPLDVIIDASTEFKKELAANKAALAADTPEEEGFEDDFEQGAAGLSGTSYWFNVYQLQTAKQIHNYLEQLPETGKVLSLDTTMSMLTQLNDGKELDNIILAVMYKRLPKDLKQTLFTPYMSKDANQVRFAIRVYDSDPNLKRDELIKRIKHDLVDTFKLEPQQVKLTGMLVLYNNMLQSLFKSQILTIGVVFLAILGMFVILFRSLFLALIAIVPNITAAGMVLGLMGWLGIPLDIMTITIAAITIGIAVDDTIHYIHRFQEEFVIDQDYWAAIKRCHKSIGRAMYYTSITITLGFSILALSNFIPTIYFGLLTGFAMIAALIANLTLLPVLIAVLKPMRKTVGSVSAAA